MPTANPTIAILTDFGDRDWYVASMKAVIRRIAPAAKTIDITHRIEPGNVRAGAFVLSQCFDDFPEDTVFLCVVDPGVGSQRRPIILFTGDYTFVAPDNGLLSLLNPSLRRAFEIQANHLDGFKRSATFHGRDVFAPIAALLANGAKPLELATPVNNISDLGFEFTTVNVLPCDGQFIYFDHYGNALSNLKLSHVSPTPDAVTLENGQTIPFRRTFSDVPRNHPVAYLGSSGLVELAVNQGSARVALNLETANTFRLA